MKIGNSNVNKTPR